METNLVHGEGDYFGKPFRLHAYERRFVYEAYELNADGSRRYDRALLGIPKGNGKTELAAAIGCAELAGPVVFDRWGANGQPIGKRRVSPDIPVAAASFDQADLLFGTACVMIKHGPLVDFFDVFETEILIKGAPGRMYRVAAIAGTNDGGKPSFFLADELHEWLGKKKRVHVVISNGRAKRADSWELGISTAGSAMATLLGQMVLHGRKVLAGKVKDDRLLFRWYEPRGRWECEKCKARTMTAAAHVTPAEPCCGEWRKKDVDLTDPEELAAAIREANPAADAFLNVAAVAARASQIEDHEYRRYHLNQWAESAEQWLPGGWFEDCSDATRGTPADGTEVVLAIDGTPDWKSTGIVGCTVEERPHLFVVEAWERTADSVQDVSSADVDDALRRACERFAVRSIGLSPKRWPELSRDLEQAGFPVVAYEPQKAALIVPACSSFYDAVKDKRLTHDGSERLLAHFGSAKVKEDSLGRRIIKAPAEKVTGDDGEKAAEVAKHTELAFAGVMAHDLAVRGLAESDDFRPQ